MAEAVERLVALAATPTGRIFVNGHVRKDKHGHRVHVKAYFRNPNGYDDDELLDAISVLGRATSDDPATLRQIKNQRAALISELRGRTIFKVARKLFDRMPLVEKGVDLFVNPGPTPWPTLLPSMVPMSAGSGDDDEAVVALLVALSDARAKVDA